MAMRHQMPRAPRSVPLLRFRSEKKLGREPDVERERWYVSDGVLIRLVGRRHRELRGHRAPAHRPVVART